MITPQPVSGRWSSSVQTEWDQGNLRPRLSVQIEEGFSIEVRYRESVLSGAVFSTRSEIVTTLKLGDVETTRELVVNRKDSRAYYRTPAKLNKVMKEIIREVEKEAREYHKTPIHQLVVDATNEECLFKHIAIKLLGDYRV